MKKTILLVLVAVSLQGCFLAPAIDSFKRLGVTEEDRMQLLPKSVKNFHEALYWGKGDRALAFATKESRSELAKQMRSIGDKERIIDSKVEFVDWKEDGYKASVEVSVQYYKIPFYIVSSRLENQEWTFSVADGWRIQSREVQDVS